ncbi:hypothetical protein MKX01_019431 [Papaver californicum]|nr:hypothetical protein MKX01_019431 [Papaver californicum]
MMHMPVGIGIQGLDDTFILLGMPFDSPEAQQLNKDVFECIYYHSLKASSELAAKEGPYETHHGSPVSKKLVSSERCAELTIMAATHGLKEAWISDHPVLTIMYLAQYMPSIGIMYLAQYMPSIGFWILDKE